MRVMMLGRVFSGLEQSLEQRQWQPRGVPAIARLMEGLAAQDDVELLNVLGVKERKIAARFPAAHFDLPPVGAIRVLPWRELPGPMRRLSLAATELDHAGHILALVRRFRPDVIYSTFSALYTAGLLARLSSVPVILRLMGLFPFHREMAAGRHPLGRFLLRAPFAHVICTQDGSGPEFVLPPLLGAGVPFSVSLNGVDVVPPSPDELDKARQRLALPGPAVVFLGRLEAIKGCNEFVEAALTVLRDRPDAATFVVVGDGSERAQLEQRVAAAGRMDRFRFLGSVPGREVAAVLRCCDVYVSLNKHGNLSNANLEAIAAGLCLLIPAEDPVSGIDVATRGYLPDATAVRFDRHDMVAGMASQLSRLLANPNEIDMIRAASQGAAGLVKTWDERVAAEIGLIRSVAQGRAHRDGPGKGIRHHDIQ